MKKMFEDTKIGAVLSGTIDVLWAGLLWLFCSLPVVTVGPASAALYYTMVKAIRRERGSVGKTFFSAFAANFRVSFLIWLVYLIVIGPLLFLPQLVLLCGSAALLCVVCVVWFSCVVGLVCCGVGCVGLLALLLSWSLVLLCCWSCSSV